MTYHEALRRGDILLCLPRNVRDVIYTQLLNDIPELGYIEVPQILDVPFPPFASFSDLWYTEACQLMIERATFSLTTDCALFNLIVFFNEFEQPESYEKATALEFTNLSLFEKSDLGFSANSTKLLRQCPNLKRITLIVDLNDVKWTFKRGGREINIDAMLEKYDLEALTRLGDIEVVAFQFQPSMSLGKQLMKMEAERLGAKHKTGLEFPGPGSFWGLKEWLETKALGNMRILGVVCQDPFKV